MQSIGSDKTDASQRKRDRPRILCIVDGPDWIFKRHVLALERYLGNDFCFVTGYRAEAYVESDFDLIYPLEFNMVGPDQIGQPNKYLTGIRSFTSWVDWDFLTLINYLNTHFRSVHVVSKELYDLFLPYLAGLSYVTHGVDLDHFTSTKPVQTDSQTLRLGWAGNRQNFIKGFDEYIQPMISLPGVELVYCGYADQNIGYEDMPSFYDSIDAYICASSFEGNNNSLLEAAAMERAVITTSCGTVPEFLQNNHSALIEPRDYLKLQQAVQRLLANPELRIMLGKNARKSLQNGGWDWKIKAEGYREFFESALDQQQSISEDRLIINPPDYQHFASVIQKQFVLERELRIGFALQSIATRQEMDRQINQRDNQMMEIRNSETFRLAEWLKSSRIAQALIRAYHRLRG